MADIDFAALALGEVVTSGKGAKSCPITYCGSPPELTNLALSLAPMQVCFEPSAYGDPEASRVNIVFKPDDETVAWLEELDEWVIQAAARESLRFFGKVKTAEQLTETYQPIVKRSTRYPTQFKAKMNLQEPNRTKMWDEAQVERHEARRTLVELLADERERIAAALETIDLLDASDGCRFIEEVGAARHRVDAQQAAFAVLTKGWDRDAELAGELFDRDLTRGPVAIELVLFGSETVQCHLGFHSPRCGYWI